MLNNAEVRGISSQLTSQLQSTYVTTNEQELMASIDNGTSATGDFNINDEGFSDVFTGLLDFSRLGDNRSASILRDNSDNRSYGFGISRSDGLSISRSGGLGVSRSDGLSVSRSEVLSNSRSSRLSSIKSDGYSDSKNYEISVSRSGRFSDRYSDKIDDKSDKYGDSRRGGFGKKGDIKSEDRFSVSKSGAYDYTRDGDSYTQDKVHFDAGSFSVPSGINHALSEIGWYGHGRGVTFVQELDERLRSARASLSPVPISGRLAKTKKGGKKYHRKTLDMKSRTEIGKSGTEIGKLRTEIGRSRAEIRKSRAEKSRAEIGKSTTKIGKSRAVISKSMTGIGNSRVDAGSFTVPSGINHEIGRYNRGRGVSFVQELDVRLKAARASLSPVPISGRLAKTKKGGKKYHRKTPDKKSRTEIRKSGTEIGKTEIGRSRDEIGKSRAEIGKSGTEIGKLRTEIGKSGTEIGKSRAEKGKSGTEMEKSRTAIGKSRTGKSRISVVKETVSSYLTTDGSSNEYYYTNTARLLKALEILGKFSQFLPSMNVKR